MSFGHHCLQIIPVYVVLREFRKVVFPTVPSLLFLILNEKRITHFKLQNPQKLSIWKKLALRK